MGSGCRKLAHFRDPELRSLFRKTFENTVCPKMTEFCLNSAENSSGMRPKFGLYSQKWRTSGNPAGTRLSPIHSPNFPERSHLGPTIQSPPRFNSWLRGGHIVGSCHTYAYIICMLYIIHYALCITYYRHYTVYKTFQYMHIHMHTYTCTVYIIYM